MMTWDYLAGFTDGEGWIGIVGRGPRATWGQNHRETLDLIQSFLGDRGISSHINTIAAKPPRRPNPIHMLAITRRVDLLRLLRRLSPKLIQKKTQAAATVAWIKAHPSRRNVGPIDLEKLRALALAGYTQASIGTKLRCSAQRVAKEARKTGITFKLGGAVKHGRHIPKMSREEFLRRRCEKEHRRRGKTKCVKGHKRRRAA